jgi:hypothetical protein
LSRRHFPIHSTRISPRRFGHLRRRFGCAFNL